MEWLELGIVLVLFYVAWTLDRLGRAILAMAKEMGTARWERGQIERGLSLKRRG